MDTPDRYRTLRPWLLETFGRPMHRIALDAGSSCPNRDGSKGFGGCHYCDVEGSGTGAMRSGLELADQLEKGLARVARREPDSAKAGAIAYFQSYSNTYVSPERWDEMVSALTPHLGKAILCIAIATRPDTLPTSLLERLGELARSVPIWIELGLETADDAVLEAINRLHTLAEFHDAVDRAHRAGLQVIGHAIAGLPGDGRDGFRRTARELARARVQGVKVHHLMVLERTRFAHDWRAGKLEVLDHATYVDWLADFVERLAPEQVLHRLTGDSPEDKLIAPHWGVHKNEIRRLLEEELERRGTRQGSKCATQCGA